MSLMSLRSLFGEVFRFGMVGVGVNVVGYAFYLLLTWLGGPPKIVMTCLYFIAVAISFNSHRLLTFSHKGQTWPALVKFLVTYMVGYVVNLSGLVLGVDVLGYPHQLVQAMMIAIVAVILFAMLKLWAFPAGRAV